MSDQYVGEIRAFGCKFAPRQWAFCNGQLLPLQQNVALFSILGTNFGGNGTTTFGLPNLQGSAAVGQGQLSGGGSEYPVGSTGGAATVTLIPTQMAAHNHSPMGSTASTNGTPNGLTWANAGGRGAKAYFTNAVGTPQAMNPQAFTNTGGNGAHNNLMPFQVLNFCIALQGIFPTRS